MNLLQTEKEEGRYHEECLLLTEVKGFTFILEESGTTGKEILNSVFKIIV